MNPDLMDAKRLVDAGIGKPLDACKAMEMGAEAEFAKESSTLVGFLR